MSAADPFRFGGDAVAPGQRRDFLVPVSESYSGATVSLPVQVWHASRPGPALFVAGAVHGDEINGTGTIRSLILDPPFDLVRGTLLLVPVVNLLGFERHARYLPDRRDLNRCFPGSAEGSLASRYAGAFFRSVVSACDYGIDLHTGAVRRTNFPSVRANLENREARRLAEAFGCELVVGSEGPAGSLRRAACEVGTPTVVLEAGEVSKVEPTYLEVARRGIRNVLIELGMVDGEPQRPAFQALVERTHWLRAGEGGLLQFHVAPGDLVERGQPIATTTSLLGEELGCLRSSEHGIVFGMTTVPTVAPGDPVCHLAIPSAGIAGLRRALDIAPAERLGQRLRSDLATSVSVAAPSVEASASTTKAAGRD